MDGIDELKPHFGIGETEAVIAYVAQAIPALCKRINAPKEVAEKLLDLGMKNCNACAKIMPMVLADGMVNPVPEARAFWQYLSKSFVDPSSELLGKQHLQVALDHLRSGGNILMVQNHRSGADTMVWETLVNRYCDHDVAQDWAYMSGHAVNLYLIPFMFTGGLRRFQIFSVKYQSTGLPNIATKDQMGTQNIRALRALATYSKIGSKLVGLYPEGGRGDSAMKIGEPQTMCVGLTMAKANPNLMVLPTYVDGTTNILPVVRGHNEYNEVFLHSRPGKASLRIGRPVMWRELLAHPRVEQAKSETQRQVLCNLVLSLIATLAPSEDQMGPYANPEMRQQVATWI